MGAEVEKWREREDIAGFPIAGLNNGAAALNSHRGRRIKECSHTKTPEESDLPIDEGAGERPSALQEGVVVPIERRGCVGYSLELVGCQCVEPGL